MKHQQRPDFQFEEEDESWFVFSLLLIRLGLTVGPESLPWFDLQLNQAALRRTTDPLGVLKFGVEAQAALRFVSTFLCFFVVKGPRYQREIAIFKEQYIPKFWTDVDKQVRLLGSARPSFATTPLDSAKWETVSEYFRVRENETPLTSHA